jgi:hypothetical protein
VNKSLACDLRALSRCGYLDGSRRVFAAWKRSIIDPSIPLPAATSSFVGIEVCVTPLSLCSLASPLPLLSFP